MYKKIANAFCSKKELTSFFKHSFRKTFSLLPHNPKLSHLFSEEDFESAIRFSPIETERLSLYFMGSKVKTSSYVTKGSFDYNKVKRLYKGGATVNFCGLNHHSNILFYWSKYLEKVFECKVHFNLYETPAESRGFNPHKDAHDVLIFQTKGQKEWSFYKDKFDKDYKDVKVYSPNNVEVQSTLTLDSGSLLYVPSEVIHSAKSKGLESGHITIGLTYYSWAKHIKESIDIAAKSISKLNSPIPILSENIGALDKELSKVFEELSSTLKVERGIEHFKERYKKIGEELEAIEIPSENIIDQIKNDSLFELKEISKLNITFHQTHFAINLSYRTSSLKLNIRLRPIISFMKETKSFSIKDINELLEDKTGLLFCKYLYKNGIIDLVKI